MRKIASVSLFFIMLTIAVILSYFVTGVPFPGTETKYLWFYSGIVMVLFSLFFVEPYYTAPTNVTANGFAILLLLISVRKETSVSNLSALAWTIIFTYTLTLFIAALVAIIIKDAQKSKDATVNYISENIKELTVKFGPGKILYSANFLFFLILYNNIQRPEVLILLVFWWIIVASEPQRLIEKLDYSLKREKNEIGEIFGVQSGKMFLAKLFKDKFSNVNKFDLVQFHYSMQDEKLFKGIIFDSYLLNQEKWIKILILESSKDENHLKSNVVYKGKDIKLNLEQDVIDRFVGIVIENSQIGSIKFEVSSKSNLLQEGDLLEIQSGEIKIYYQVINGITDKRILETKNEAGFVRGEAIQLGVWNDKKYQFEKFGWVPQINSIVLKAKAVFEKKEFNYPEYVLGKFPGTDLPTIMNLHDSITHHLAILGITGSGKSFITREIIKELLKDTKVICIDFTGEYIDKLSALKPEAVIKQDRLEEVEILLAEKSDLDKTKYSKKVLEYKKKIHDKLSENVATFIASENNLGLFELPELSNTTFILEFTQLFLDSVFRFAKDKEKNKGSKRICIIIEEAHTVIPETSSLGDLGDYGSNKALVNKIGQIALQGRKYGVGFVIIAQRTANVSKTVLTQCNSIISFQAFDQTSYVFLENYIGKELIGTLPNLKQYHAIVCGKGFKSNIPMIVDLSRTIDIDTTSTGSLTVVGVDGDGNDIIGVTEARV